MTAAAAFDLREGTEADLPALEWEGEYRRYREVYRASLQDARRGARRLIVAEISGRVVGQIFVQYASPWTVPGVDGPVGYLYAFRVRKEHRGLGIGQALLDEAEAALRGAGVAHAVIAVARHNPDARRLYERNGYRWIADDPGRWSYIDERGARRQVSEPSVLLAKRVGPADA